MKNLFKVSTFILFITMFVSCTNNADKVFTDTEKNTHSSERTSTTLVINGYQTIPAGTYDIVEIKNSSQGTTGGDVIIKTLIFSNNHGNRAGLVVASGHTLTVQNSFSASYVDVYNYNNIKTNGVDLNMYCNFYNDGQHTDNFGTLRLGYNTIYEQYKNANVKKCVTDGGFMKFSHCTSTLDCITLVVNNDNAFQGLKGYIYGFNVTLNAIFTFSNVRLGWYNLTNPSNLGSALPYSSNCY